jgi:hypothetical protein
MIDHARTWLRHQQSRWLRPDADRWVRPDARRFISPGGDLAKAFPALAHKYNPDQPRVPAGSPDGGQWTDGSGGAAKPMGDLGFGDLGFGNLAGLEDFGALFQITPSETDLDGVQLAGDPPEGIGHNQGPSLDEPPEIPQQRPETRSGRMDFVRSAVSWIGRVGRYSPAADLFLGALDQAEDLKALTDAIKTANDPPATLEQLQENALKPSEPGYQNHHIDEQSLLRSLGYSQSEIDRPDNVVRMPTLKHYEITGWYARSNPDYGGLSPREYLKSQPESIRRQVGIDALIRTGVLKP